MSKKIRISFWLAFLLLYCTGPLTFLFTLGYIPAFLASLFSFPLFILIIIWYSLTETESHYGSITLVLILISIFVYFPVCNFAENTGVYLAFKPKEKELTDFVSEIKKNKNIEHISKGLLNYELIKDDKYIFENYGIEENEFERLINKMESLQINTIKIEKNVVKFYMTDGLGKLAYIDGHGTSGSKISEAKISINLTDKWYMWDY